MTPMYQELLRNIKIETKETNVWRKKKKSVSSSCFLDYCYSVPQYFRISTMVQNIIILLFSIYFERKEREPLDYSGKEKKI